MLKELVKAGYEVVVDAELVADDGSPGRSTTLRPLGSALPSRTRWPGLVRLLWCEGHELVDLPDRHRRRVLEELALPGSRWYPGSTRPTPISCWSAASGSASRA